MHIQPLQLLTPHTQLVPSIKDLTVRAKDAIRSFIDNGWFSQDEVPGIYICRITTEQRAFTGVIALNSIQDFHNGQIKKHEKTLAQREAEYHHLLQEWQSVIKPVLLTYPAQPLISNWISNYTQSHPISLEVSVPEDKEQHQFWAIQNPADIAAIQALFADLVPVVYIADGHHRTTTIAHLAEKHPEGLNGLDFSTLFSAFFADDQLVIKGYHRVVELPETMTEADFLAKLNATFLVTPLDTLRLPASKRELVVVLSCGCHSLLFSETAEQHILDATLLNDHIFGQILNMGDARAGKQVIYIDGAKGATEANRIVQESNGRKVGFLLYPVDFDDLFFLSDNGESLPPKSTWFEPRIKSGLTVHSLKM